jgi:hypothetical protein
MRARLKGQLGAIVPKSQRGLIRDLLRKVSTGYPPSPPHLSSLIRASRAFERIREALVRAQRSVPIVLAPAKFAPAPAFVGLKIPQIATAGDLAAWLDVSVTQLDWLADSKRQHAATHDPPLRHYHYAFVAKSSGLPRLLESPKSRLKAIQRRLLHEILDNVPVHDRAHGFVKKRSCISAASAHAAEAVVLTVDIRNFFSAIATDRIHALFRGLGYPWSVARLLTGLCTTVTPHDLLHASEGHALDWHARNLLSGPHLPQGAPTSPALANLVAWRLDRRLHGLAERFDAHYTRYADDMAFSGDAAFARQTNTLLAAIKTITSEEGFSLNDAKTRIMPAHGRQSVAGIVVNAHVNIARMDYDRLKATLHNCASRSPMDENRDGHPEFRAHLCGRVGWVGSVNPARGAKLRAIFNRIAWPKLEEPAV